MKKIITTVLAAALLVSATAMAKNDYSVGKGNWLVGAYADVNRVWGGGMDGRTTFNMATEVGYFVWDWLLPEAQFDFGVTEGADSELFTGGARAYWNKGKPFLPFVRLNLGVGSIKIGSRATRFVINPGIGAEYLVAKNVAIGIQFNYEAWVASNTSSRIDIPIGFSIYF